MAMALVILALGAAGAAFALARDDSFRASVELTPATRGVLRPSIGPAYVRRMLRRGRADLTARLERSGFEPRSLASVRVRGSAFRAPVRVSAAAGTPNRAGRLLTLAVRQIDALSADELADSARGALGSTRRRLADPLLVDPVERVRLVSRVRSIRRYLREPRARFGASRQTVEQPARWADRVVAALPGPFPQRPSPLWAALTGMIAGGLLASIAALAGRRTDAERLT